LAPGRNARFSMVKTRPRRPRRAKMSLISAFSAFTVVAICSVIMRRVFQAK
jgi:hypothetical protein